MLPCFLTMNTYLMGVEGEQGESGNARVDLRDHWKNGCTSFLLQLPLLFSKWRLESRTFGALHQYYGVKL